MSEPFWKELIPQDELEAQWHAMAGYSIPGRPEAKAYALARFAEARMYERARQVVERLEAQLAEAQQWRPEQPIASRGQSPITQEALREALAAYAHEAWSGWMKYMFSKCHQEYGMASGKIIPKWAVERWQRQAATPYADLPESEKESDRAEADKMLAIVTAAPLPGENDDA